jgi:hypothetical protein
MESIAALDTPVVRAPSPVMALTCAARHMITASGPISVSDNPGLFLSSCETLKNIVKCGFSELHTRPRVTKISL